LVKISVGLVVPGLLPGGLLCGFVLAAMLNILIKLMTMGRVAFNPGVAENHTGCGAMATSMQ
jgi:hypothetical protein